MDEDGLVQTTYYGYEKPGDPDYDSNSANGDGDREGYKLSDDPSHHSAALTQSERLARFGVVGKSTGQPFEWLGQTYYDEDTAPESNRRIDVYSPSGPGPDYDKQYDSASQVAMTDEQIRQHNDEVLGLDHEAPKEPDEKPKEEEAPKQSLVEKFRQHFPAAHLNDDQIIAKIQPAFPEVPPEKLAVFAKDPNAEKLIRDYINRDLTPLEKFRKAFPKVAKDKNDDQLAHWLYDNQATDESFEQFRDKLSPPSPTTNSVKSGLMAGMEGVYGKWEQMPKDSANALEDLYKKAGVLGWEKQASSWLRDNISGYAETDDWFRGFIQNLNNRGKEWEKQAADAQAQIPKDAAGQVVGTVAQVAGSTPDIALSFGLGSTTRAAMLFGMAYEGTSAYGKAIEEHQKNALAQGAEAADFRAFSQFLMNTGMGRVASGFTNAVASASEEELQKWLRGEPNDITKDGKSFGVGLLTGLLMGKGKVETSELFPKAEEEKPLQLEDKPMLEWHGRPVIQSNVLGTESGEVPIPEEGPIKIGEEESVDPNLRGQDWIDALNNRKRAVTFSEEKQEFTFHNDPAINEELNKAVKHHQNGDDQSSADHYDRALALMPKEDKQELLGKAVKKVEELGGDGGRKVAIRTEEGKIFTGRYHAEAAEKAGWPENFTSGYFNKKGEFKPLKTLTPDVVRSRAVEKPAEKPKEEDDYFNDHFFSGIPIKDFEKMWDETIPKVLEKAHWQAFVSPETYGGEASETAAAIIKAEKGRSAALQTMIQGDIVRDAGIVEHLKGGLESANRENYFNKFSDADRIQQFLDYQDGKTLKDTTAEWVWRNVYGPIHDAMEKRENAYNINYDHRDNYFYQLLSHPKDDLPRLLRDVSKSTGGQSFVKPRQMRLVERLALGHKMLTTNPERLLQIRWAAGDRAVQKIRAMRELAQQGYAYRTDDPDLPYEVKKDWPVEPTNEYAKDEKGEPSHKINYHVSPAIVPVINNAFDIGSIHQWPVPLLSRWVNFMGALKGLTAIKISWALYHQLHIAQITGADVATEAQRRAMLGVANKGDMLNAITGILPGVGVIHIARANFKVADEINALQNHIHRSQLTPEQLENVKMFMDMGLKAHMNEERQMQFQQFLMDRLPEEIRKAFQNDAKGANFARVGFRALNMLGFQNWWFETLTPRIKMASAIMRRDTLFKTQPDLFKPQNRMALLKEYQKIGRDIEGRYGEMNYDILLWPRWLKEVGTAHMLSLGWQIGLFRTTGDAVIDLTHNVSHMKEVMDKARAVKQSGLSGLLTNRLGFGINYNMAQLILGGAITYMATKTIPTLWDMVYPRIGKDDKGQDKRVQMQGFMKDFPAAVQYTQSKENVFLGLAQMFQNKLNPGMLATLQAATNRDYMGKPIGNMQEQLNYWLKQAIEPISFENAQLPNQSIGDQVMDHLGFTPSGKWTTRSGSENEIISKWAAGRQGHQDITDAREEYRHAYNIGDAKALQAARVKLGESYKKEFGEDITEKQIKRLQKDSKLTTGQKVFNQLPHQEQIRQLKAMEPEERERFLPHASKEVRQQFNNE